MAGRYSEDSVMGILIFVVMALALAWVIREFRRAPIGYEDSEGFHYVDPPEKEK